MMIDQETLEKRIAELGKQLTEELKDEQPLLVVGLLKGGAQFMSQLGKSLDLDLSMDYMVASSYGSGTVSSGEVKITKDLDEDVRGRHVLIAEDIVDTGRTLYCLKDYLLKKGALSVKIVTMLDKPARRVVPMEVEYSGFVIEDKFVVGYGLDFDQKYRNLPYIGVVEE